MSAPDLGPIQEILRSFWHRPVLLALVDGPLRYSRVAAVVGEKTGRRPGDGTVTKALNELRGLGLIHRQSVVGTRHHEWALTGEGRHTVDMLKMLAEVPRRERQGNGIRPGAMKTSARSAMKDDGNTGTSTPTTASKAEARPSSRFDTSVPHPARRYNYWLGGKDHFAADRESGDRLAELMPTVRLAVRENRRFQTRVVRYLAAEAGIRQFLDIGTGIPAPDNPHEVAQAIDAASRVAYVDNDPVVLAHSRALLNSTSEGATCYVDADVRDPDRILNDLDVRATLDFSRPVAVLLVAVLHFVDDDHAYQAVARLAGALPPGSFLAISHTTWDHLTPAELDRALAEHASGRHGDLWPRSRDEILRFFTGLDLVIPGVVPIAEWHDQHEPQPRPAAKDISIYGGVAQVR